MENVQVFVLSDPAADAASEPAAVALVQSLGDDVAEIRLAQGRPGALLARLLGDRSGGPAGSGHVPGGLQIRGHGRGRGVGAGAGWLRNHGHYWALELLSGPVAHFDAVLHEAMAADVFEWS